MAQGEGMNTYHSQIVDALVSIGWTPPPVPPCPPIPVRRCIVWGCGNRSDQGKFNDNICWSCYNMLTSGEVGKGTTFIHNLDRNLAAAAQEIEKARLADVLTYLDLLAEVLGVDLGAAAVEKFNEISARVGFPDRIDLA